MAKREIPFFVDNEESLRNWEMDSYLVDRKNLFWFIFRSTQTVHDLFSLLYESKATSNNFAKLLNELVSEYGAKDIDEKTIECSVKVKQAIYKRRKEIFFPKLNKSWKKIPPEFIRHSSKN